MNEEISSCTYRHGAMIQQQLFVDTKVSYLNVVKIAIEILLSINVTNEKINFDCHKAKC